MSSRIEMNSAELPLSLERLIDKLCDDFEESLKRGDTPDIACYVDRIDVPGQASLRSELLKVLHSYGAHCDASAGNSRVPAGPRPNGREAIDSQTTTRKPPAGELLTTVERADEMVAKFRSALEQNDSARVDDLIKEASGGPQQKLLRKLLDIEMAFRAERQERPRLDEYRARFPQHVPLVKHLYFEHFVPPRIGEFVIERLLGRGGFGQVYLAADARLSRSVAIKIFRRDPEAPSPPVGLLFEAQAAAQLRHEGIVTVFAVAEDEDGDEFLVLDFVDGISLEELLQRESLSVHEAVRLMVKVAIALQHSHEKGLVHRDLKPANILLDQEHVPHVTDFGLALRTTELSNSREIAGTLPYMAPEQVKGEMHLLDGRTDVWAMGVILYRVLSGGQLPFRGVDREDTIFEISYGEPRSLSEFDLTIPVEASRIVGRCLAKRMSERYQSAAELADDLMAFIESDASSTTHGEELSTIPIAPKGLSCFDAGDQEYFLKLVPGPKDRRGVPEKVRFWERRLRSLKARETFRVGLIYGPSGCGKSSLLRAGILPRLPVNVKRVVIEATSGDTESTLLRGLRQLFPQLSADASLAEVILKLREGDWLSANEKLLIVIDQFEQWLHGWRHESQSELIQALRQCDGERVQTLVLIRDDFWMPATRFFQQLEISLTDGTNAAAVDLFDLAHAKKVLTAFGKSYGCIERMAAEPTSQQQQFLDLAVAGLSEGGWGVPVHLCIFVEMMKTKTWTPAAFNEVGGRSGLGVAFLSETFEGPSALPRYRTQRSSARLVLERLLPPAGADLRGHHVSANELRTASAIEDDAEFLNLLKCLDQELHLITPVDASYVDSTRAGSVDGSQSFYQLTHDFLVAAARDWLNQSRRQTARGRAELRLAEYSGHYAVRPESRQLPSWWEWLGIVTLTSWKHWSVAEKGMMQAATRRHVGRVSIICAMLLVLVASVYERVWSVRAEGLVQALATSDNRDIPKAVESLLPYRWWVSRRLTTRLADGSQSPEQRVRLLLGELTVGSGPAPTKELAESMLSAEAPLAVTIATTIGEHGGLGDSQAKLMALAQDRHAQPARRLRAAVALAQSLAKDDAPSWVQRVDSIVPMILDTIAKEPETLTAWADGFSPIKEELVTQLRPVYLERLDNAERPIVAAELLARYQHDDVQTLSELALTGNPGQLTIITRVLGDRLAQLKPQLVVAADDVIPTEAAEFEKDCVALRKANAVLLLKQIGDAERLRRSLEYGRDSRLRSFVIDYFRQVPDSPKDWLTRLNNEQDPAVRQAIILVLGRVFTADAVERRSIGKILVPIHNDDPDSGVHSATTWSLQQLGCDDLLQVATTKLAGVKLRPGFGWYVTKSGLTMIVVRAPGEIEVGSPPTEPNRDESNEAIKKKKLDWSFAVSATEITQEQMLKLCPGHSICICEEAPSPSCPANYVSWLDAVEYCRRLSEQDGFVETEMAIPPVNKLKSKYADFRTVPGYRLPVELEWEFACRAATVTPRPYGYSPELVSTYECVHNPQDKLAPVTAYFPNRLGVFGMLGNVSEWCMNIKSADDYCYIPKYSSSFPYMVRGGHFRSYAPKVRSANRRDALPEQWQVYQGFRIAQTIMLSSDGESKQNTSEN